MKQAKKVKKLLIILVLTLVLLVINNTEVFADINETYSGTTAATNDAWAGEVESTILDLLARLVYNVGGFLEWILGTIFRLLTGVSDFPWADKIVFNAVPLLDINFINPHKDSFVGTAGLRSVLQDIYATVLTLAITFFGIVVLVTAIKLVLTTIASEKAKYKQAIVSWITGFVTLFCIHYAISFIFYLNEELVKVASNMVTAQLKDAENVAHAEIDALTKKLIENVRKANIKVGGKNGADILEENYPILSEYMHLASEDSTKGLHEALTKQMNFWGTDGSIGSTDQYKALVLIIKWAGDNNVSVEKLQEIKDSILPYMGEYNSNDKKSIRMRPAQAIPTSMFNTLGFVNYKTDSDATANDGLKKYFLFDASLIDVRIQITKNKTGTTTVTDTYCNDGICTNTNFTYTGLVDGEFTSYKKAIGYINSDIRSKGGEHTTAILSSGLGRFDISEDSIGTGVALTTEYYWTDVLDDLIHLKSVASTGSGTSGSAAASSLIPNLATYFKYNAYGKELGSNNVTAVVNDTDKVHIQNMLMYAILVGQSLILFIAYVKRLFYVILLAMMAPVVVVFDFFQKFGK